MLTRQKAGQDINMARKHIRECPGNEEGEAGCMVTKGVWPSKGPAKVGRLTMAGRLAKDSEAV